MGKFPNLFPFLLLFLLSFLFPSSSSLPLCTDLRAPTSAKTRLSFCPYNEGKVCCNLSQDLQIRRRFMSMNISHSSPDCASAVKAILCAACDPFSSKLFTADSGLRSVPILCNSTGNGFCSNVWKSCLNVTILNSPFAPALQTKAEIPINATSSTLAELWQSESDFCASFGGSSNGTDICFNGEPVSLNNSAAEEAPLPPRGICLEKISNLSFIDMAAHPDGSGRAFFSSMSGKIYLATIPDQDSGEVLKLDVADPFMDLSEQLVLGPAYGLMSIAFHPQFTTNGRFFVSFNCDKEKSPACSGRCACNSDVGCDPSKVAAEDGIEVCQYHSVVAEYSANGTAPSPGMAESAKPNEVRRIFTLGLPYGDDHGGQILFGPADGYLYLMMGDGGSKGDPYNFAQNKKSLLGKVMRLDVDTIPSDDEITKLDRWGNYSVPRDNPYSEDKEMVPEIWAYGLKNPWRCSFDAERPAYFLCADTGENDYEEVNVITKGGNYGWRVYEGPNVFKANRTPGGNTSADSIDPIFPVSGYDHAGYKLSSAAILGGYFYRSQTDPCIYGSYLYADLYGGHVWAATESPENSGNFTTQDTPFRCASDSPLECGSGPNDTDQALHYVVSFGQDNKKDVYILTYGGVYRVVRPSRCNYACSKEVAKPTNDTAATISPASASSSSYTNPFSAAGVVVLVLGVLFHFLW